MQSPRIPGGFRGISNCSSNVDSRPLQKVGNRVIGFITLIRLIGLIRVRVWGVNPKKLETGLGIIRAGIPYTLLLLRIQAIEFPTFLRGAGRDLVLGRLKDHDAPVLRVLALQGAQGPLRMSAK